MIAGQFCVEQNEVGLKLTQPFRGKRELRDKLQADGTIDLGKPLGKLFDTRSECED
jgi:hypothetical protein